MSELLSDSQLEFLATAAHPIDRNDDYDLGYQKGYLHGLRRARYVIEEKLGGPGELKKLWVAYFKSYAIGYTSGKSEEEARHGFKVWHAEEPFAVVEMVGFIKEGEK